MKASVLHVLVIVPGFEADGPGRVVQTLLEQWNPGEVHPVVVALGSGEGARRGGIESAVARLGGVVEVVPTGWGGVWTLAGNLRRRPWFPSVNVILASLLRPDVVARQLVRQTGLPLVVMEHGLHAWSDKGKWAQPLVRHWYCSTRNRVARFVAVSEKVAGQLTREGVLPGQLAVIENGVPPFAPVDAARRAGARTLLGVPPESLVLATVGLLKEGKCPDLTIRVAALLSGRGRRTSVVLAGHGPMRMDLKELAATLGVTLASPGAMPDVGVALAAADVIVHPSRQESFGLAPLEGLAAGRPVIARDGSGLETILPPEPMAYLCKGDDPAVWAAAVETALASRSPELAAQRSQFVQIRFGARHMAERYLRVLHEAVEGEQ